jgi:hydroxyacylglutathione hydrolase
MPVLVHSLRLAMSRAYLIECPAGLLLVDAGIPGEAGRILQAIRRHGSARPRLIFITHGHFDHYGSASALRQLTGALIAVHAADAPAMARGETPVASARSWGRVGLAGLRLAQRFWHAPLTLPDLCLQDGDRLDDLGLEARVLHTPGHTSGSSCLILERRLAFAGDLLTTTGGHHPQRLFAVDWTLIGPSLARLQAIHPDWVYPGHGRRPLTGAALQDLRAPDA